MWVKQGNAGWIWQGDWPAQGRAVYKPENAVSAQYDGQVLRWDSTAGKYGRSDDLFTMTEVDKQQPRAVLQELKDWKNYADLHRVLPVMGDLSHKANNIIEMLGDGDDPATIVAASFNGEIYGVCAYEITGLDGLENMQISGDQPEEFLYATYWVAHPLTQVPRNEREQGAVGGVGSALRMWTEYVAAKEGLRVIATADNARSYIGSLRDGYLDGGPQHPLFPPAPEVIAGFALA